MLLEEEGMVCLQSIETIVYIEEKFTVQIVQRAPHLFIFSTKAAPPFSLTFVTETKVTQCYIKKGKSLPLLGPRLRLLAHLTISKFQLTFKDILSNTLEKTILSTKTV